MQTAGEAVMRFGSVPDERVINREVCGDPALSLDRCTVPAP